MEELTIVEAEKSTGFQTILIDILNKSALSFMISIGHRTGLFDKMSEMGFSTPGEIAEKASINERYLREWLGAMVTGGIVDYDAASGKFSLPEEHSRFLTRKVNADNMAVFMQYFSLLGTVEDDILQCFSNGGGVPYSKFRRFHEVMAEDSGQSVLSSLETHILPLVQGIESKLESGIKVLDVGCGAGRIVNRLATLFPRSKFTGMDLSDEAVRFADEEAARKGLKNVSFIIRDLSDFHETAPFEQFDLITSFDAIHDQAKPLNVLKGIFRALKKDGVYLMQDISGTGNLEEDRKHLIGPFLYTISCMHCMTVSLAQGGEGVGAMWGEEMINDYLGKAGFSSITKNRLDHDFQNYWFVVRK